MGHAPDDHEKTFSFEQSIRIVYRDIGAADSMALSCEETPRIKPAPNLPYDPEENRTLFEEIRKRQSDEQPTEIPA
ncbi:hypothetical protein [Youxingia wuxianensis]|uniref:Uncharacterized protein n=1 Tax=Youxingia wuxianensis TaxID=2763678 RepID=A0A926EMR1_9FIRM|nr:hypothetical protein [Youxingia wuxianensis]MBC8584526.1 hypothetical protein [Youxingia wuxianensis]